MKKTKKSLYDRITAAVGVAWLVSVCAVDTVSWIPVVICAFSTIWLAMYVLRTNNQGGDCNAVD